jgi:two-component system, sensor histidine kinase and response regulator
MLLNSLDAVQVELHAFAATGRWCELASVAHRLKSSARASGARYLGELLHRMEVSGRADEALAVKALLPRLVPAINRFRDRIQFNRL